MSTLKNNERDISNEVDSDDCLKEYNYTFKQDILK